jgi:hypothetical protein
MALIIIFLQTILCPLFHGLPVRAYPQQTQLAASPDSLQRTNDQVATRYRPCGILVVNCTLLADEQVGVYKGNASRSHGEPLAAKARRYPMPGNGNGEA